MSRICLDTCAYSLFKRGKDEVVEAIESAGSVLIPAIVLGELRTGFRLGNRGQPNESELLKFLSHPAVEVLDVDDDAATLYADIMLELRKAGTPVPTNDVWIAALATREGVPVLTCDAHFGLMRRVGVRLVRA